MHGETLKFVYQVLQFQNTFKKIIMYNIKVENILVCGFSYFTNKQYKKKVMFPMQITF